MPTENLNTSEKIRLELDRQNISATDFSAALGITQTATNRRLRLNAWNLKMLEKAATVLNVTVQDLV